MAFPEGRRLALIRDLPVPARVRVGPMPLLRWPTPRSRMIVAPSVDFSSKPGHPEEVRGPLADMENSTQSP
jgi:hypothetical protein